MKVYKYQTNDRVTVTANPEAVNSGTIVARFGGKVNPCYVVSLDHNFRSAPHGTSIKRAVFAEKCLVGSST